MVSRGVPKDLQSEIETHRDVYASLTGTGRRLLGSLSSQEDAVMLQRRLDEMNQRWHHLKAKSMAIRGGEIVSASAPTPPAALGGRRLAVIGLPFLPSGLVTLSPNMIEVQNIFSLKIVTPRPCCVWKKS
ncbi:hypothetical protein EVAR_31646_1 [Eumeta japonica]|uniref:Dystrophin n=1 Tax=Eumeta variegata TaxID=151549 RepID=A0A4C1W0W8_EUMVA|nr:hypothetical protein EVAR_31646_1 [Eumeta japonica]